MTPTAPRSDLKRWRTNFRDEVDGAALYRAMADSEPNPELAQVYRNLGAIEAKHAGFWADQTLEALPQNVNTNSKPSDLKITDLRVLVVARAPMTCPTPPTAITSAARCASTPTSRSRASG